ncbi:MAG: ABC transporter ATP-binding protein [Pseudomonadota bacterium]
MASIKANIDLLLIYVKDLLLFTKLKFLLLFVMSLINALGQGLNFYMLIPMFSILNIENTNEAGKLNKVSQYIYEFYNYFNVPVSIASIIIVFLILSSIVFFLRYKQTILTSDIQLTYTSRLQKKLFESLIFAEWTFVSKQKSSNISQILTSDLPIVSTGTYFALRMFTNFALILGYIFWAMSISIKLTLATLLISILIFYVFKFYFSLALETGTFMRESRSNLFSILMDHLSGVKLAKSYGKEEIEKQRFQETVDNISYKSLDVIRYNSKTQLIYNVLTTIILGLILYYSLEIIELPLVNIAVFLLIFSKLIPCLSTLQSNIQKLISMLPSFSATENLYKNAIKHKEDIFNNKNYSTVNIDFKNEIRLKDISFKYENEKNSFSLNRINFQIPVKKITVIEGKSGKGKTTLLDIIAGILKPDIGEIFIDDTKLDKNNLYSWRQKISYLPQEVFLFHDTIKNNLLWSNENASEAEIIEALKLSSAYDFVNSLPQGINTIVKDRGQRLSGGERQRIAIARTLIKKPEIIILDEATSSLDENNEKIIFNTILKLRGKFTIIIASHSKNLVNLADNVINLNKSVSSLE